MKKVIIGGYLALSSFTLWAACSTHTYYANGKYVTCTTVVMEIIAIRTVIKLECGLGYP